uniref:Uncharacterized protein n=1 Tax=Rhabditophanes sp. KR3021 TaxID=114890 RepID=A0AC35TXW2_9BILA
MLCLMIIALSILSFACPGCNCDKKKAKAGSFNLKDKSNTHEDNLCAKNINPFSPSHVDNNNDVVNENAKEPSSAANIQLTNKALSENKSIGSTLGIKIPNLISIQKFRQPKRTLKK